MVKKTTKNKDGVTLKINQDIADALEYWLEMVIK